VLWLLVFRRAPARNGILAAFVAAMLFATRMEGEHGFAWITLVDKAFLYGGLVWLLVRSGLRVVVATLATAVLLLAAGVAASHGHVRPSAFGDPAVAVCAGAVVALCALSLPRRSRP
jgi:hypothetical protein